MAAITWADVEAHDATVQAAAVAASVQNDILDVINDYLDVNLFGGEDSAKTRLLRILLATHMAVMHLRQTGGGNTGAVVSESGGGLSRTYSVSSSAALGDSNLGLTPYGQMYLELINTSSARGPFNV